MEKFDGKNGHDNMQRNKVTHRPRISYASATHKLRIGYASATHASWSVKSLIHMNKLFFLSRFAFDLHPFSMPISWPKK